MAIHELSLMGAAQMSYLDSHIMGVFGSFEDLQGRGAIPQDRTRATAIPAYSLAVFARRKHVGDTCGNTQFLV
ncbi:MAG TPA: hypothetical protein VEI97_06280, partial [bacterium]|nr:hypothetical protein [bacterium]